MKRPVHRVSLALPLLFAVWLGCAHDVSGPRQTQPAVIVSVSVSPASLTLPAGGQIELHAKTLNWQHDSSVHWAVVNADTAIGSLAVIGSDATFISKHREDSVAVTIRVRSNEDTTQHADCHIVIAGIRQNARIALSPSAVTLTVGARQQFTAAVYGPQNNAVRWRLLSGPGELTNDGQYAAPAAIAYQSETATIEAVALADTTIRAQAVITIQPPADPGPCFRTIVQPLMVTYCGSRGCHNPDDHTHGIDFTTYPAIMKNVVPGDTANSLLYQRITHVQRFNKTQIGIIVRWILSGAHETQCIDNGPCDTTGITYTNFVRPLMVNDCVGCHSARDADFNRHVDLTTYDGVAAVALDGRLVGCVSQTDYYVHMPEYGQKIDACELAKLNAWVNRGAPND